MMGKEGVDQRVRQIISLKLNEPFGKVNPESHITRDLGADSQDIVDLGILLENEFKFRMSDEDHEQLSGAVQGCIDYVASKTK